MSYILIIFIIFVGGGSFLGKLTGKTLFPNSNGFKTYKPTEESPTIINNYTTNIQQNLNITEEQLNKLKKP
ncbi:hypothetical protein R5N98_02650 [Tenacibaculum maritimum]|uniref:hypothetical protein n=1 Tax=Tenacibaculum maritimum TaxID=107401 RepID=UPI0012E5E217|nr:hypothetical protein [Tenacibaculum maritimum]CAA0144140.1 hypothetical protein TM902_140018 [Tenacibaculum maritimum]CAA0192055.1 hypothetical protein TFA04_210018 [Tenacibaculum maritimum]CAA0197743.1 hypothetical protein JIP32914_220066 [Tenacibaculum maritimum]